MEAELDLPLGGRRALHIRCVPLIDEAGEVHEILGITHDRTERKRAEDEIARHRDRLEELVGERTLELEEAHEKLVRQERLATLGQLTATVSHELRNPLGTVRTSVFTIRERVDAADQKTREILDRAERNIVRCDTIIEELLDYTRTRQVVPVATPIDEWIGQILDEQRIPPGVSVIRRLHAGVDHPIDREKLRRCLVNLVTNACQAMEDCAAGGGELTVESRRTDDRIEIVIHDTGPGIPPEQLDRVFEPLFSTKGFGVGLGLSIVRQIAEAHGGGVGIHSTPGCGATATLWLPRKGARRTE